jgi:hypothetical protein
MMMSRKIKRMTVRRAVMRSSHHLVTEAAKGMQGLLEAGAQAGDKAGVGAGRQQLRLPKLRTHRGSRQTLSSRSKVPSPPQQAEAGEEEAGAGAGGGEQQLLLGLIKRMLRTRQSSKHRSWDLKQVLLLELQLLPIGVGVLSVILQGFLMPTSLPL